MAGKKGQTWNKPMTEQQRDSIACTKIEKRLDDHINGKNKLSITQLRAMELRYNKLRPSLSSVEQHTVGESRDDRTILEELRQAIEADPSFRVQLQALLDGKPVIVSTDKADTPNPSQPDIDTQSKTGTEN